MTTKKYSQIVRELENELADNSNVFTDGYDDLALDVLRYRQDEMKSAKDESELWERVRVFLTAAAVEMQCNDSQTLYYAATNQYGLCQAEDWERIMRSGVNYTAKVVRIHDWHGGWSVSLERDDYKLDDFEYVEWEGNLTELYGSSRSFAESQAEKNWMVDAVALFI